MAFARPQQQLTIRFVLAVSAAVFASAATTLGQSDPGRAGRPIATTDSPIDAPPPISADSTHLFVVRDPLPHLRALFGSRLLAQTLRSGVLARDWSDDNGRPIEATEWLAFINANERWIPQQLSIASGDAGVDDLARLLRVLSLYELLYKSLIGDPDDGKLQQDAAKLRAALTRELPLLHLPRIQVFTRFRTPEQAKTALELVRGELTSVAPADLPGGLTLESKPDAVVVRLKMADRFGSDDAEVLHWLQGLGLTDETANEADPELARALKSFRAEVILENVGDGILLTLGPREGAQGLSPALANTPAATNEQTIAWWRWNGGRLAAVASEWLQFHDQWATSAAYAEPLAGGLGYSSLMDSVRTTAARLVRSAPSGSAVAAVSPDRSSLHVSIAEEGVPRASLIAAEALHRLVPKDVELLQLQSTESLAVVASDLLVRAEDGLLLRRRRQPLMRFLAEDQPPVGRPETSNLSVGEGTGSGDLQGDRGNHQHQFQEPERQTDLQGEATPGPEVDDAADGGRGNAGDAAPRPTTRPRGPDPSAVREERFDYFRRFSLFREVVRRESGNWFEGGSALMVGTAGRVDRLELSVELEGRPRTLSVRGLAAPEAALVGRLRSGSDAEAARQHFERFAAALADGLSTLR